MSTTMQDDKFLLEHIFSQSITPNTTAEGSVIEISIDKLSTIFLSTNKSLAEIGLV